MSKCLWSGWKWQKRVKQIASPFVLLPYKLWMFVKENPDRKKQYFFWDYRNSSRATFPLMHPPCLSHYIEVKMLYNSVLNIFLLNIIQISFIWIIWFVTMNWSIWLLCCLSSWSFTKVFKSIISIISINNFFNDILFILAYNYQTMLSKVPLTFSMVFLTYVETFFFLLQSWP